jgi:formylglycine-generating enzyme required for sulfatase activity
MGEGNLGRDELRTERRLRDTSWFMRVRAFLIGALLLIAFGASLCSAQPDAVAAAPVNGCDSKTATAALPSLRTPAPLSQAEECALRAGDIFKECESCPDMMVIPSGSFKMGSSVTESGRYPREGPQHPVTIAAPFAIGKFHVTFDQFAAFVAETHYDGGTGCWIYGLGGQLLDKADASWRKPGFDQSGSHPVTCLNWNDANAYVGWLAGKAGRGYRLLSEAEWEYAARAGTTTPFFFGTETKDICRFANGADETAKRANSISPQWPIAPCSDGFANTSPVGSFLPNGFGLSDMSGNVWDWLMDCYHATYGYWVKTGAARTGAPSDGSPWMSASCETRVLRGASWDFAPRYLRVAFRGWDYPGNRYNIYGLRVARTLAH